MATYVRAANPIWLFVDLVGQVLNDEYYISFLTNTFPYLPQNVFHTVNGTPWSNPLQFYPNGTLPNNLFFDPNLVYRLEIRRGPTQSDPLIYEINNFSPGQGGITPNDLDIVTADNQITNPQFAEVFFTNDYVITAAGTYHIAPGWDLIITGVGGSTTLTQLILSGSVNDTGNPESNGNPPYALRINSTGWSTVTLQQRFNNNGALWTKGAIAGVILARASGASEEITMNYVQSDSGMDREIFSHLFTTGNFQFFGKAIDLNPLPSEFNNDLSTVAYTNINLELPTLGIVEISNIQITGQTLPLPADFDQTTDLPAYDQETIERNIDHQFHVYQESLLHQPKENLLTGWIFGLNPWQFTTTTVTNVANNTYTADQTIIIQQAYVTAATANNIAVGRGTNAENFAFVAKAVTAANKFAMIQYIDPATIRPYWGKILSSLVNVTNSSPTHSTAMKFKMRLIYRTSLPSTIGQNEPIASWTNVDGSNPVFAAGWTEIIPMNDPEYTIDANGGGNFSFNQFQLPASSNDAMTLAIVIYTTKNMVQTATADRLLFNTVSLVHNDFAIEAASETFDESLRKCQFYYEKSYDPSDLPGTVTNKGEIFSEQFADSSGGTLEEIPRGFQIIFKNIKRSVPVVQEYSPASGTVGNVFATLRNNALTVASNEVAIIPQWGLYTPVSLSEAMYVPNTVSPIVTFVAVSAKPEGFITFHYVADARMGM